MRPVLPAVLALVLATCGACGPRTEATTPAGADSASTAATIADLTDKTVALVGEGRDGGMHAYCSGAWVGPKIIVTAGHCVAGAELGDTKGYDLRGDVFSPDGVTERDVILPRGAHVIAVDAEHDVALLEADGIVPEHGVAALADATTGERVMTMGHPLGLWWSYSEGNVAAVRVQDTGEGETLYVQTTAPVSPGNSGGGLFDAQGRLLGVCHGYYPRGQNLNLYVATAHVRELLWASGRGAQ